MLVPLAAGSGVEDALLDLFVILLAAKIGDELFKWIGQPSIVGEILAGVVVGPSVLDWVAPTEVLEIFAEVGVVFLLFWVGLETRISELRTVGKVASLVGIFGVALPLAGGVGLGLGIDETIEASVFIGAALVATSVGITSAILIELRLLTTPASRTILGAAVIDDILAMIVLAIAVGIGGDGVDAASLAITVVLAVAFVAFFALGGTALMRRLPRLLHKPRFSESPLLPAVLLCLGLAVLAGEIGLAAIIGAFLAGLMVAETKDQHPIEDEVAPLYAFFAPFFFAFIGTQVDLDVFTDGGTVALLAGVTAVAIATKFVGAWIGARTLGRRNATFVAVGMVPRGEVGIIVAGIGMSEGVVGARLFAVIVAMSVLTTLLVPPLLRLLAPPSEAAPAVR